MIDGLPPSMPDHVRAALAEAKARLVDIYGDRLARIVLYGSHARGDAGPESDVDLLVVLKEEFEPYAEIKRTGGLAMDLLLAHRTDVSIQPYSLRDAEDQRRPFVRKVYVEGLNL